MTHTYNLDGNEQLQDDTLSGDVSSVDIATQKNLDRLLKVGDGLLKQPVSRVNLETGKFEACNYETNAKALIRYLADWLYTYVHKHVWKP